MHFQKLGAAAWRRCYTSKLAMNDCVWWIGASLDRASVFVVDVVRRHELNVTLSDQMMMMKWNGAKRNETNRNGE